MSILFMEKTIPIVSLDRKPRVITKRSCQQPENPAQEDQALKAGTLPGAFRPVLTLVLLPDKEGRYGVGLCERILLVFSFTRVPGSHVVLVTSPSGRAW